MPSRGPLVVVVGPTASGKSDLAMKIAQKYDGEIIAADSRTIYQGLNVGTAKPTLEDQRTVRHHLLDILNPGQSFSAAQFKRLAEAAIDTIQQGRKLPVLVGGTGLYIDAVLFDYQFGPVANVAERKCLNELTIEQLWDICRQKNIDIPINSHNKRHLIRAVELGGLLNHQKKLRDNTFVVGISTNRDILRERIEQRARVMVGSGVVDEVAAIGAQYQWRGEALKGNVYRIFKDVVEGSKTVEEAIDDCIQSDMALAKRQITWFKRNPAIQWSDDPDKLLSQVDTFLLRS